MYRYAEITSLLYPIQELQDRISLEVPADFVKEESTRESENQQKATYTIVYYPTADGDPKGKKLDAEPILERLVKDVLDPLDIVWDMQFIDRSRDTSEMMVTVTWPTTREAKTRTADVPYDVFPLTIYAEQNVYNIATDGNQFFVLKNGEPIVSDAPSPAYALGSLVSHLRDELAELEVTSGVPASPPSDFLAAMAMSIIDTPELSEEAQEHFIRFYELATLTDWAAEVEGDDG